MNDLVNRLCGIANEERHNQHVNGISFVCDQAADRIAALEAENNELQAWVDGYREHGTRVLNANKEEIDTLKAKLDAIANYPDPDFPMEDTEEELKRAWQIIYRLKGMAALQQEGE